MLICEHTINGWEAGVTAKRVGLLLRRNVEQGFARQSGEEIPFGRGRSICRDPASRGNKVHRKN